MAQFTITRKLRRGQVIIVGLCAFVTAWILASAVHHFRQPRTGHSSNVTTLQTYSVSLPTKAVPEAPQTPVVVTSVSAEQPRAAVAEIAIPNLQQPAATPANPAPATSVSAARNPTTAIANSGSPVAANDLKNVNQASNQTSNTSLALEVATLKPGESLSRLFLRYHISQQLLQTLLRMDSQHYLTHLKAGQPLEWQFGSNRQLKMLQIPISIAESVVFELNPENKWRTRVVSKPMTAGVGIVSGTIKTTLLQAAQQNQISSGLVAELTRVFNKFVNLKKELTSGTKFAIVYQTYSAGNKFVKRGPIEAAELVNSRHRYEIVRYQNKNGRVSYYTPAGDSLDDRFSRAPIQYSHISSYFSYYRYHPLLHYTRPHLGVDYSATRGTPIQAASDGSISFFGLQNGYGRCIQVRHDTHYSTFYAHLSHFAKGLSSHSVVKKGQIIGYVGDSGLATAPHLHFEIRVDGIQHDPLTVKLPGYPSLLLSDRQAFLAQTKPYLDKLDVILPPGDLKPASISKKECPTTRRKKHGNTAKKASEKASAKSMAHPAKNAKNVKNAKNIKNANHVKNMKHAKTKPAKDSKKIKSTKKTKIVKKK